MQVILVTLVVILIAIIFVPARQSVWFDPNRMCLSQLKSLG